MQVKMRTNIACEEITASAGAIITVSSKLGQQLLTGGYAVAVKVKKENAALKPAENATTEPGEDGAASPDDDKTKLDETGEDDNTGDDKPVKLELLDPDAEAKDLPSYNDLKVMAKAEAPDADVQHNTAKVKLIQIINEARIAKNAGLENPGTDEE